MIDIDYKFYIDPSHGLVVVGAVYLPFTSELTPCYGLVRASFSTSGQLISCFDNPACTQFSHNYLPCYQHRYIVIPKRFFCSSNLSYQNTPEAELRL